MSKYIDAEKLITEIERYKQGAAIARFDNAGENGDYFQGKVDLCNDLTHIIANLQQEQPDTCIFGNIPSEEACKFCGVDCELREPKQSGITSTNLSSTNEAVGLAIMAYLDTKVKHDNAKVCGVSLRVAREWIREKIANKQEQPEVDLDEVIENYILENFGERWDGCVPVGCFELDQMAEHFYELGRNARKEDIVI